MSEVAVDVFLAHYGVKGMKWGVRKDRKRGASPTSLVSISPSGSITMEKGATLQRVVRRSNGLLFDAGEALGGEFSYASFSEKDNLIYETMLGRRKNVFNKKASEVLTLTAKTKLKSPSPKEAAELYYKTLRENPEARTELESRLRGKGLGFTRADVEAGINNPTSVRARDFYSFAYDKENYADSSTTNRAFLSEVKKAGYNMLLDPSDSGVGISDTPVVLLDPMKNVEITGRREVTRSSLKSANAALADIEKISDGRTFLETLGLDED